MNKKKDHTFLRTEKDLPMSVNDLNACFSSVPISNSTLYRLRQINNYVFKNRKQSEASNYDIDESRLGDVEYRYAAIVKEIPYFKHIYDEVVSVKSDKVTKEMLQFASGVKTIFRCPRCEVSVRTKDRSGCPRCRKVSHLHDSVGRALDKMKMIYTQEKSFPDFNEADKLDEILYWVIKDWPTLKKGEYFERFIGKNYKKLIPLN
uniref:Zn_Tnp_IS91 domain-containing protein n=1 Tax=Rhabditophanes sp. KR3021 TaxID=114890 RepID=A0AC35U1S5_9BILA